jgi:hypothetical protein
MTSILLKPVLGDVGGLAVYSYDMNRLSQTDPATFSISLFWAFFYGFFVF